MADGRVVVLPCTVFILALPDCVCVCRGGGGGGRGGVIQCLLSMGHVVVVECHMIITWR